MNTYKALNKQIFKSGNYSIMPIRNEDRYSIMKWRNEQVYHLRQIKPLTKKDQEIYFKTVVAPSFELEEPNQILFSYLEGNICIGYGGLVHINWIDSNAEISFIMDTVLEKLFFEKHWKTFLSFIEEVAFHELHLHKIYTYAFDLRPHLYPIFEFVGYKKDAVLRDHIRFNENYVNIIIHSKIHNNDNNSR